MYKLNLTLDVLPKSLNMSLGSNPWQRNKVNNMWDTLIFEKVRYCLPTKPLLKARIRIVRHFYRTLDYDGLVGSMKPVVDALVTAGVLSDDNWEVTGPWDVSQIFRQKKAGPLLEIEIVEVPEI